MNSKITLPAISQILADKSGRTRKECEAVLKSLFANISSSLEEGEQVRVKGFGTFKISKVESRRSVDVTSGNDYEIPAHSKIVFLPAKELAQAVNAPFEMFETIELEESVLEEELMQAEAEADPLAIMNPVGDIEGQLMLEKEKKAALEKEYPALELDKLSDSGNPVTEESEVRVEGKDNAEADRKEDTAGKEPEKLPDNTADDDAKEDREDIDEKVNVENVEDGQVEGHSVTVPEVGENGSGRRSGFGHGFLWGAVASVALIGVALGILYFLNGGISFNGRSDSMDKENGNVVAVNPDDAGNNVSKEIEEAEIGAEENDAAEIASGTDAVLEDVAPDKVVPTRPSDAVVYDTITKTHYLTTMAKKHYGNYHLWPYIYKENEKFLGHPDRIRPGTRVVIPPLSKYGVDPKNKNDIEKARRMGVEIYSHYR